ncbi:hypothetical protein [Paenibacillus tarimensis]|uniref:hypothetical protein n=1 Tax=Paenibacillus tarimensis TaxID=416012 RepID=UPI001F3E609A|nr:hypothetical protein [Paenibacillus tarimensis]MCF2943183.1 hypothetical protein [Paenibacillus tarimensis]
MVMGVTGAAESVPAGRPPVQTEQELEIVKRYVIMGIAMRILDHDIRIVGRAPMKLPRFYESLLRALQDRVLLEMAAMRKQFREVGIKIYEEHRSPERLTARYVCRGYHHEFSLQWNFVRVEAERILKSYTPETEG